MILIDKILKLDGSFENWDIENGLYEWYCEGQKYYLVYVDSYLYGIYTFNLSKPLLDQLMCNLNTYDFPLTYENNIDKDDYL